ncbi:hypothetical protein JOM56_000439 [Amanita muscaria]
MAQAAMMEVLYYGQIRLVYDHLHTLPMEIRYMWLSRRLTTVNVLYYITKYGIFFSVVELYRLFNRFITAQECHYTIYLYTTFTVSIVWAGEAVLGIRIWAIWGKNRYLTIALPIIFCALFITNFIFTLNYIGSLEYGPSPAPQFISCFVTKANKNVFVILICMPAWVALMLVLLTTSAYLAWIIYYIYLLLLHGGNLVLFSRVPRLLLCSRYTCLAWLSKKLGYYAHHQSAENLKDNGKLNGRNARRLRTGAAVKHDALGRSDSKKKKINLYPKCACIGHFPTRLVAYTLRTPEGNSSHWTILDHLSRPSGAVGVSDSRLSRDVRCLDTGTSAILAALVGMVEWHYCKHGYTIVQDTFMFEMTNITKKP